MWCSINKDLHPTTKMKDKGNVDEDLHPAVEMKAKTQHQQKMKDEGMAQQHPVTETKDELPS